MDCGSDSQWTIATISIVGRGKLPLHLGQWKCGPVSNKSQVTLITSLTSMALTTILDWTVVTGTSSLQARNQISVNQISGWVQFHLYLHNVKSSIFTHALHTLQIANKCLYFVELNVLRNLLQGSVSFFFILKSTTCIISCAVSSITGSVQSVTVDSEWHSTRYMTTQGTDVSSLFAWQKNKNSDQVRHPLSIQYHSNLDYMDCCQATKKTKFLWEHRLNSALAPRLSAHHSRNASQVPGNMLRMDGEIDFWAKYSKPPVPAWMGHFYRTVWV